MYFVGNSVWQKRFKGWEITDCSVRNKNVIYACLRKNVPEEQASFLWDTEIPTRFISIYLDREAGADDISSSIIFKGFEKPATGVCFKPREQGLIVSRGDGSPVHSMGLGGPFPHEFIDENEYPNSMRLVCIDGYSWSVGLFRCIYKRVDINKWERVNQGFPTEEASVEQGLRDLDGWSEQDMYAVGGCGDVWHYDGSSWTQCDFPSNEQLSTVTCAPDGHVYIGGEGGSLWVGREHTWKKVYKGHSTILWNDSVWFEDKLWLCSDYQLKVWNGTTLDNITHHDKPVLLSGHMDARDGILMVASLYTVDVYDGHQWQKIVGSY